MPDKVKGLPEESTIYAQEDNKMNKKELMNKFMKEECEQVQKERAEREANPLSQYSTTELKKELRRRKRQ